MAKKTGNIVKDDPKAAAKRSPTVGQFKHKQPSNQAKSDGWKRKKLAEQARFEIEQSIAEVLKDPSTDVLKLKSILSDFPKEYQVGQIIVKLLIRNMIDSKTKATERARLLESIHKIAYGESVDLTTNGEKIETTVIYRPEKLPDDYFVK